MIHHVKHVKLHQLIAHHAIQVTIPKMEDATSVKHHAKNVKVLLLIAPSALRENSFIMANVLMIVQKLAIILAPTSILNA